MEDENKIYIYQSIIKEVIDLPEHILPLWILAFGIPNQNPPVKDKWNEEKILRL